jgi:D-tyrosyl-tRNA(Tyr) deacylase
MKAVVQRVKKASVEVNSEIVGEINRGLVILLGVAKEDQAEDADYLAEKISQLRIFNDAYGKMNLSLEDVQGSILAISQFTLLGNTRKGRRPSFIEAALPHAAEPLYNHFIRKISERKIPVEKGVFGAMMLVKIYSDGPVTILLDSNVRNLPRNS